jgi:sialidase-1
MDRLCWRLPFRPGHLPLLLVAVSAHLAAAEVEFTDQFNTWHPQTPTWKTRYGAHEQLDAELRSSISYLYGAHENSRWNKPAFSDLSFAVRFRIQQPGKGEGPKAAGIVFRSSNSGQPYDLHAHREYWVLFDIAGRQVLLQRQVEPQPGATAVGGEQTIRQAAVEIEVDHWHQARVECVGTRIQVFFDGKPVLDVEDDTYASGMVGLLTRKASVAFDDLHIRGTPSKLDTFVARDWNNRWELIRRQRKFQLVCEDAGAGGYEAFPDVVRLANGDLLCGFFAGDGHVSHPSPAWPRGSRICSVRSTDEGRTWGPPKVLVDTPWDDRDPSLCQLADGTVLVNWMTNYVRSPSARPGNPDPYTEIWLARSADNGRTWTAPQLIESTKSAHWKCSSPIRRLLDGTLIMSIYDERRVERGTAEKSAMIMSSDGGLTWSRPHIVDPDNDDNDEPAVIPLRDGRLLCVMRTNVTGNTMWESVSLDGGKTWTKSEPLLCFGNSPYLFVTSNNILLLAYRRNPIGTWMNFSLDFGKSWSDYVMIDAVRGGYPSMAELPDGRILVVYYEEGYGSSIRSQIFRATREGIEFERMAREK